MAEQSMIVARFRRGFARMGAWVAQQGRRFGNWWHARPEPTPGQLEQERETSVSLGLMSQAVDAGAGMTPEQQIFLSQSEHGMRERLSVLLGIPHRSLAQEREKVAIEAWLTRGAAPLQSPLAGVRLLGPAASPMLGLLSSPMVWVAAAFAIPAAGAAVQTARLNHAKSELSETRADLREAVEQRDGWRSRATEYAAAVTDAREVAQQTAAALEAERRAQARAAARERRRQREIQDVLANSPEPPAWRLRDDESIQE